MKFENSADQYIPTNYHADGVNIDASIMNCFMELYKKKTGNDLRKDKRAYQNLYREVKKAKRNLPVHHIDRLEAESSFGLAIFAKSLARDKFEEWSKVSSLSPPYTPLTSSRATLYLYT